MKDIRYTFKVNNKKVKTTLILVSLFIFLCFSAITVVGYIRGLPVLAFPFLFGLMFSLSVFILLWFYGKYRMFGFEWQLCDDGLRILKSGQEIRFIPWKDIADIESGYKIIDGRDNKRFAITLPPIVRKDMVEKMYELKEHKLNPGTW